MPEFLVETYASRSDHAAVRQCAARARAAADLLTREGRPVRFVRTVFVPEDETCFYLYEAASVDTVHEAAQRAALPFERVAEAVPDPEERMK